MTFSQVACLKCCKLIDVAFSHPHSNTTPTRPPGDADYVRRVGSRSPKLTRWVFGKSYFASTFKLVHIMVAKKLATETAALHLELLFLQLFILLTLSLAEDDKV